MSDEQEPQKQNRNPSVRLEYDAATGAIMWQFDGNIPIMNLVGALEMLKATLIDQQIAKALQAQQQQSKIVVPMPRPRLQM